MNHAEIIEKLQPIFADILDVPDLQLSAATTAADVEGWDSLAHINLVTAVEKLYKVRFALGELQGLKNVGDMADLIAKKLAA
jgi:acyl carrier protein